MQSDHIQEHDEVKERDNLYVVEVELSDYQKEDIQAVFHDGYLVVSAGEAFKKAYYIGKKVSKDNIRAAFHNGILKCMITKTEKEVSFEPVVIEIM